jgi:Raf kinase inhibitor-like YbhB/YbcL family protein
MKRFIDALCLPVLLISALIGCGPSASPSTEPSPELPAVASTTPSFDLTSPAFQADALIPDRFTCHGAGLSPALAWSTPPVGTQSLALVVDDPDAVKVAGHVWDHWLLFNVPPGTHSLSEGIPATAELTDRSRQGKNSSSGLGYTGPCPPGGQTHVYRFVLYAVDIVLDLKPGATKAEILQAIQGHILAQAELDGRYASP